METKLIATIIIALVIGMVIGFFIGQSTTGQYGRWIAMFGTFSGNESECPQGKVKQCVPTEKGGQLPEVCGDAENETACKKITGCEWKCA